MRVYDAARMWEWDRAWNEYGREISDVGDGLFLSATPRAGEIRRLGIKNVLDVAAEVSDDHLQGMNLRVAHFFINDGTPMDPTTAVAAIKTLRAFHRSGKTLVHCGMGISRSPTIIALYWYATGETDSVEEGIELLKVARPCVRPNTLLDSRVMRAVNGLRRSWLKSRTPETIRE